VTRVIAGRAGGRRLAVPGAGTRPTSDRVREALFSTLDSDRISRGQGWSQARVLDLFAGSGALGLEALSRGAAAVLLVEKSASAAKVLRANISAVDLPGADVLVRDVRRLVGTPGPYPPATLVLADPPYDWAAEDLVEVLESARAHDWIADGADVVVERPGRDSADPIPSAWDTVRRRDYGDTALWYGRVTTSGAKENA
jgi:16S rRNA (guanine966-N2)-methyltransferase